MTKFNCKHWRIIPFFLIYFLFSCSNQQNQEIEEKYKTTPLQNEYDSIQITPKNYLDFEYNKVVVIFTLYGYPPLALEKDKFIPELKDTIHWTLSTKQINFLNEILSGKHRKAITKNLFPADCFNPRHHIVFLNKENKIINFISICFECDQFKKSKADLADFENMETFFNSVGLPVFSNPKGYDSYFKKLKKEK